MVQRNPNPRCQTVAGFTLLEMLVVLAILALLSAVALPRLRLNEGARLRGTTHALVVDLRLCRDEAIRRGTPTALVVGRDGYRLLPSGRTKALPSGIGLVSTPRPDFLLVNSADAIRFFPDGSSTGGTLLLQQGQVQVPIVVRGIDGKASLHG
jgi:general secretion pathway protein H